MFITNKVPRRQSPRGCVRNGCFTGVASTDRWTASGGWSRGDQDTKRYYNPAGMSLPHPTLTKQQQEKYEQQAKNELERAKVLQSIHENNLLQTEILINQSQHNYNQAQSNLEHMYQNLQFLIEHADKQQATFGVLRENRNIISQKQFEDFLKQNNPISQNSELQSEQMFAQYERKIIENLMNEKESVASGVPKSKSKWTVQEVEALKESIKVHGPKNFQQLAQSVSSKNPQQVKLKVQKMAREHKKAQIQE